MRLAFIAHKIRQKEAELAALHREREDVAVAEAAKGIKLKVLAEQAGVTAVHMGRIRKAGLKRL